MYKFDREAYDRRMEWYRDARFGMFIHWGLYAIPARGEWVRSTEQIPKEDYMKYFEEFNPVDFEPRKWAKAAKEAGMKYVVLTAKHHDGFCLFDSQYTDFKSTNTKCGRDLVAEYVDAVRAEGLKVGLYFSLLDWFHDDFPHYGDRNHPMRNNPAYKNDDRDFDRYLTYMHNQVREICTNYGKLDVLWFDFSYDTLRGEAWKATELINMVRKLQPDVIIDFSTAKAVPALLAFSKAKKIPVVLCTTALSEETTALMQETSKEVAILKSANMSVGVNLLLDLVQRAAVILAESGFDIEIVEKHHNQKIDAPSGTAMALADAINQAMEERYHYVYDRSQVREKREKTEIGIHAVRGGNIVGEHDVIFAGRDEVIELTHRATSREVFAVGAVKAAKFLAGKPAGLYTMKEVLQ